MTGAAGQNFDPAGGPALDARSGKELWRWYVVPKPGEPGSETWKDKNNAWKTGGGGLWQTGSYDPATKLTIWGTGNPVPIYDPQARPGDNLYTNSVVAVNIDTGKLAWYFQYTPNDSWDFDEVGVHMLYDETLEELWRFNVGTPLKGAPVTYAIGPKQYLAVQTSGRHLHPVKFDKLENSSYLFVFALN